MEKANKLWELKKGKGDKGRGGTITTPAHWGMLPPTPAALILSTIIS